MQSLITILDVKSSKNATIQKQWGIFHQTPTKKSPPIEGLPLFIE